MSIVIALPVIILAVLAMTFLAVHRLKPERFRLRAKITGWCQFELEIDGVGEGRQREEGRI